MNPRDGGIQPAIDLSADRERALALTPVSRETSAWLDRFTELLLTWQGHTNLIARSTIPPADRSGEYVRSFPRKRESGRRLRPRLGPRIRRRKERPYLCLAMKWAGP
jgi:hypothetical protein